MSRSLTSLSPDLSRLVREGYAVEIRETHLLVHDIPYVNSQRQVLCGTLMCPLTLAGNVTAPPSDHVMWFIGEQPCEPDGSVMTAIAHGGPGVVTPTLRYDFSFSHKPSAGYPDYYEKVTGYANVLTTAAMHLDPSATACTYRVIQPGEENSVFRYLDTATSRAGLGVINDKLTLGKVAIVGLGGTGSYLLDLLAKAPIRELHLFDDDRFLQHNAFRGPGAPSLEQLVGGPLKTAYFAKLYGHMRTGIVEHPYRVEAGNVSELSAMDFVFICVDNGPTRGLIGQALAGTGVSFIDAGMGISKVDDEDFLLGQVRVSTSTNQCREAFTKHVSFADTVEADLYRTNIQVAELNSLNAALAVIKFKKLMGYYVDSEGEHQSIYDVGGNLLLNAEQAM